MREYSILLLIVLVTLSGCSEAYDTGESSTTTWDESLSVSEIYEYEELSNESKADFQMILEAGSVDSSEMLFEPEISKGHYNVIRIRYNDRLVEIRHQRQTREATCLASLLVFPPSNATKTGYTNYSSLSEEQQAAIRVVLNGSDSCYHPTKYPLRGVDIVQHDGTYYSLETVQASFPVYSYRIVNESAS